MLKLSEKIVSQIKSLILSGECKKLEELLSSIDKGYRSINNFFEPVGEVRASIDIDKGEVGKVRCMDEIETEILVAGQKYLNIANYNIL
jgi:hypothetical protein